MDQDTNEWQTFLTKANQFFRATIHPGAAELPVEGVLPALNSATAWLNTPPLMAADLRGKVVLIDFWATWCPPCVTEMPSLARLQAARPEAVRVVPVSIDGPNKLEVAKAFIAQKSAPLAFHHSTNAALAWALNAKAFPTTVIYDKAGFERARMNRPAEWDAPEVRALLDRLAAEPS